MSLTNFPDGLSNFGSPVISPFQTQGNAWHVKPYTGSDGNSGRSPQEAFKTLRQAQLAATADQNDIVFYYGENSDATLTTDLQATVLNWAKSAVHLIGVGCGSFLGQRARISNLQTATAIVNGLMIVSGHNCLISGIEVIQEVGGTNPTGASIALVVSGNRNKFVNCQISGIASTQLDDATSRSLKVSGEENYFKSCYIGLDTIIRATATAEIEVAAGVTRLMFEDCFINSYTSLLTFKAIACANPDRFVFLKNSTINAVQNITSAVAPTGAIDSGSVNGSVILQNTSVFGYQNVTTADDSKTLVSAPIGGAVDMGLGSSVDIAA